MGRLLRHLFAIALLPLVAMTLSAQEQIIAPHVEYQLGAPLFVNRLAGVVNRYGGSGEGSSLDQRIVVGFGLEQSGDGLSPFGRAALGVSLATFTSDPYTVGVIDSTNGSVVDEERRFRLDATLPYVRLDLGMRYGLGPLAARAALFGEVRLASTMTVSEERISGGTGVVSGVGLGEEIAGPAIRYGGALGFDATLVSGRSHPLLVGSVVGDVDIVALSDGLGSRSLRGGLGLSLLLPSPLVSFLPVDTTTVASPPRERPTLDLFGVDEGVEVQSIRLRVRRTHERRVLIAPGIICGWDERYAREAEKAGSLSSRLTGAPDSVLAASTMAVARDRIAAVGGRGTLVTAGRWSERWSERVEALVAASGVELVRKRPLSGAETWGRVSPSGASSLEPYDVEWMVREVAAPRLGLRHSIPTSSIEGGWLLTIERDGVVLASSQGAGADSVKAIGVSFDPGDAAVQPPLVATLVGRDAVGLTTVVRDSVAVVLVDEGEEPSEHVILLFELCAANALGGDSIAGRIRAYLSSSRAMTIRASGPIELASLLPPLVQGIPRNRYTLTYQLYEGATTGTIEVTATGAAD